MRREQLVGLIYEAACTPAAWTPALDAIVRCAGGKMGAMFFYDRLSATPPFEALAVCGFSASAVHDYVVDYGPRDTRLLWSANNLAAGATYADDRDLSFAQVARSETYQDWYRPLGLGLCVAAALFKEDDRKGFLTVHRDVRHGAYTAPQLRRFEAVLPHVIRALQLHRQVHARQQASAGIAFALDHMPHATFLVRPDGFVLHANRAATALLAAPHAPLRLQRDRLRPTDDRGRK